VHGVPEDFGCEEFAPFKIFLDFSTHVHRGERKKLPTFRRLWFFGPVRRENAKTSRILIIAQTLKQTPARLCRFIAI
jgi:hypothetical protein